MKSFVNALLVIVLVGCTQSEKINYESFGAEINEADAMTVSALTAVTDQDTVKMKLTASVKEVCQMKGCWMTLENENGEQVRVTFKDYGFFVPKDIAGRDVIVEGIVSKTELAPDVAEHYAEDAGEKYDSTRTYVEYAFLADGVLLAEADQE